MTFRWPWVSRARLDAAHALTDAERRRADTIEHMMVERANQLREDVNRERVRSSKLIAIVIRLKRDGATLLPMQALRQEKREPTAIEKAVDGNARARANPALARHLLTWAANQAALGVAEEAILETIDNWNTPSHDDDDEDDAL